MAHLHDFVSAGEQVQSGHANSSTLPTGGVALGGCGTLSSRETTATIADADTVWYSAIGKDVNGAGQHELGVGVVSVTNSNIARSNGNVYNSSNSANAVAFSGPVKMHYIPVTSATVNATNGDLATAAAVGLVG